MNKYTEFLSVVSNIKKIILENLNQCYNNLILYTDVSRGISILNMTLHNLIYYMYAYL